MEGRKRRPCGAWMAKPVGFWSAEVVLHKTTFAKETTTQEKTNTETLTQNKSKEIIQYQ